MVVWSQLKPYVPTTNSRQVKKNLRARKRFILAEKRAGRIAQTMDTKSLVEALKERGCRTEGSEDVEQLRRVFVESIKPELRIRLHATSRYGKHGQIHTHKHLYVPVAFEGDFSWNCAVPVRTLNSSTRVSAQHYANGSFVRPVGTYICRWTRSRDKHRERTSTVEIGDIAARRQRILLSKGATTPPLSARRVFEGGSRQARTV